MFRAFWAGLLMLFVGHVSASEWPAWQAWQERFISEDGRVIDRSDTRHITTSEGQSYALFFALVANDAQQFERLLRWTEANLAHGSLSKHLPAWQWGQDVDQQWRVLDSNNASDSDAWIAYCLLEAGRLWQRADYLALGQAMLELSAAQSVQTVAGLGLVWLPGNHGFVHDSVWRLNASYLPLQLLDRFAQEGALWSELARSARQFLLASTATGYVADWQSWQANQGLISDTASGDIGSYDAIRVYLWLAMLHPQADLKSALVKQLRPMLSQVIRLGYVPERVHLPSAQLSGRGPWGFSAAMLPLLEQLHAPAAKINALQQQVATAADEPSYYNRVLYLFAQGYREQRYGFSKLGELQVEWAH